MRSASAIAVLVLALGSLTIGCGDRETSIESDAENASIGTLIFPTSGSSEAQPHFLRGVAILHSFGYKQAIAEFRKAQDLDPDFALAYWGESFCYNHPLLGERDLETPRAVLNRLADSAEGRLAKAPTEREKGFLRAAEALWFGEGDTSARRIAYLRAMERLYQAHPEDDEVATFYALALLAGIGPMGDDSYRMAVQAGAVALDVFERNPNHPGAAHYVIHAFDDPVHAPLALKAADRFAEIAPAVSHARHMPSHIFIQRGMWDRVSLSNDSAYQAAIDLWQPGDSVSDAVHSLDWGQYGDLQLGDYEKARSRMELLDDLVVRSDSAERAKDTVPLMWARFVVETEGWETRAIDGDTTGPEALAVGLSAIHLGDTATARLAENRLRELASKEIEDRATFSRGNKPNQVRHREIAAMVRLAEGKHEEALALLAEGLEIAESMGPPRGSATPVKPVHELYGEALLQLERAEAAIERFEASLLRTPNRPRSLLGLARAQALSGDRTGAVASYRQLIKVRDGRALPEVDEAQAFLAEATT